MNARHWESELERYLQDRYIELCQGIGLPVPVYGLRIKPALGTEESKYFLLGLEAEIFRPDSEGYVQSELLPPANKGDSKQKTCQILWHNPAPARLYREGICQLATASSLILKRGWLKNQIEMRPGISEHGEMVHGVDILVKSSAGKILVCVEVKRSLEELQKLTRDFGQCCKRGEHSEAECGFPQNHPIYEFCALYKPTYFWAVAPDDEICFKMIYDHGNVAPQELDSLPQRSVIELS